MFDTIKKTIISSALFIYIVAAISFECTQNTAKIATIGIYMVFAIGVIHIIYKGYLNYNIHCISMILLFIHVFLMSFVNHNGMSDTVTYYCLTCAILCIVGYNLFIDIEKEKITTISIFAFVVGAFILAIRIVLSYGGIDKIIEYSSVGIHERRIGGLLLNENTLGLYMAIAFFCCIAFFVKNFGRSKIISIIMVCLTPCFAAMILLTASKKAIVFLAMGIIIMAIYALHNLHGWKKLMILFLICMCAIYMLYIINNMPFFRSIKLRIAELFQTLSGEGSASESDLTRISMSASGLSAFLNSPIIGNGTAYSYTVLGNYSHNNFIELLMNYGIIGFCIYYIPYIYLIMQLYRLSRNKDIYALFFLIYCFMHIALGVGWINYYERVIQLFTIFAAGYCHVEDKKDLENNDLHLYIKHAQ